MKLGGAVGRWRVQGTKQEAKESIILTTVTNGPVVVIYKTLSGGRHRSYQPSIFTCEDHDHNQVTE